MPAARHGLALGAFWLFLPLLDAASPLAAAMGMVLGSAGLAAILSDGPAPEALGAGAAGALLASAVAAAGGGGALAGGALLASVHAARALRSRDAIHGLVALVAAFGGGALGALLIAHHQQSALPVWLAAWALATLLSSLPLLATVDDPVAHRLRTLSTRVAGPLRWRLLRATVIRRRMDARKLGLEKTTRRRLDLAWRALLRSAEDRVTSWPRPARTLDRRIEHYVKNLHRAYRAARARDAWAEDLDDAILCGLRMEGEKLETEAAALSELDAAC